jgi:hypothetical protein
MRRSISLFDCLRFCSVQNQYASLPMAFVCILILAALAEPDSFAQIGSAIGSCVGALCVRALLPQYLYDYLALVALLGPLLFAVGLTYYGLGFPPLSDFVATCLTLAPFLCTVPLHIVMLHPWIECFRLCTCTGVCGGPSHKGAVHGRQQHELSSHLPPPRVWVHHPRCPARKRRDVPQLTACFRCGDHRARVPRGGAHSGRCGRCSRGWPCSAAKVSAARITKHRSTEG